MTQSSKQQPELQLSFNRQDEVFGERAASQAAYLEHIQQAREQYESPADVRIAACILEPVVQVPTCSAPGRTCDLLSQHGGSSMSHIMAAEYLLTCQCVAMTPSAAWSTNADLTCCGYRWL